MLGFELLILIELYLFVVFSYMCHVAITPQIQSLEALQLTGRQFIYLYASLLLNSIQAQGGTSRLFQFGGCVSVCSN